MVRMLLTCFYPGVLPLMLLLLRTNPSSLFLNVLQYVIKRDGRQEPVHFDKITARILKLSYGLNPDFCDPVRSNLFYSQHLSLSTLLKQTV